MENVKRIINDTMSRDKVNLGIYYLYDESPEDIENLTKLE